MTRSTISVAILGLVFALGTVIGGWWAVPDVGLVAGLVLGRGGRPGRLSAVAAALAWAGVLVAYRIEDFPVAILLHRLAGAMQLPAWGLLALTLLFPAVLAGSAAALGGAIRSADKPVARSR